ncbi:hypothetical protein CGRA01v4_00894 [Colletotrichum graminicola]|nr:hypothetical protein CGRA01v4_00894 [Colletotrichum graminicola]
MPHLGNLVRQGLFVASVRSSPIPVLPCSARSLARRTP